MDVGHERHGRPRQQYEVDDGAVGLAEATRHTLALADGAHTMYLALTHKRPDFARDMHTTHQELMQKMEAAHEKAWNVIGEVHKGYESKESLSPTHIRSLRAKTSREQRSMERLAQRLHNHNFNLLGRLPFKTKH